jgi:hypothetical protein
LREQRGSCEDKNGNNGGGSIPHQRRRQRQKNPGPDKQKRRSAGRPEPGALAAVVEYAARRPHFKSIPYPFCRCLHGIAASRKVLWPQMDFQSRRLVRLRRQRETGRTQRRMALARQRQQVVARRRVGRAAFQQQAVNAMKAVQRIELRAAYSAEFQQRRVAGFAIFGDPVLDDGPRLTDAAAVEDEAMRIPQVAHHRWAAQFGGALRTGHAYARFQFCT